MTRSLITRQDIKRLIGDWQLNTYAFRRVLPEDIAADTKQEGESDEQQLARLEEVERAATIENAIELASSEVLSCLDARYRAIITQANWVIPPLVKRITIPITVNLIAGSDEKADLLAKEARKLLKDLATGKMNLEGTSIERTMAPVSREAKYPWDDDAYQKATSDAGIF